MKIVSTWEILMLQQDDPNDFVIATGKQHSVREFIDWSAKALGITLEFRGSGLNEVAVVRAMDGDKAPALKIGQEIVRIDPNYFRPSEVETLLGDPTKAKKMLGWEPQISVQEMCQEMIKEDYKVAQRHRLLRDNGFELPISTEK